MAQHTMWGIARSEGLSDFLSRESNKRVLSRREVADLVPKAQAGDKRAHRKMVEHNIRLVVSIVGKYASRRHHYHMHADDLMQEGFLGLLRAIEKFEPERGHAFSTYATWWIHQRIRRAYDDQDLAIRHPVHVKESVRQFYKIKEEVQSALGREISVDEAWVEVKKRRPQTSEEVYRTVSQGIIRNPTSLDATLRNISSEGGGVFHRAKDLKDVIPDEDSETEVTKEDLPYGQEALEEVIRCLPEREERIVRLRFGFMHEDDFLRTYDEVGAIEGLTRERVRQIIQKATVRMRTEYRKRGYEMDENIPLSLAGEKARARAAFAARKAELAS